MSQDQQAQVADQLIVEQTLPTDHAHNDQEDPTPVQSPEKKGDFEKFDAEEEQENEGYFGTIMNLLNSILGIEILAGPFAFRPTGLIPSLFLLGIMGALSNIATSMLIKLEKLSDSKSLDDLSFAVLGGTGQTIVSILTLIFCITCNLAYLIIAVNNIVLWFSKVLNLAEPLWRRSVTALIYSLLLPVPLSFPKSIRFLSYLSTFTILLMLFYFGSFIAQGIIYFAINKNKAANTFSLGRLGDGINVFQSISLLSLGFTLPLTSLPILEKFNKEVKPRRISLFITTILAFIIIAIPSGLGYAMFGDDTKQIILDNFDNDKLFIAVGASFFIATTFSYPCLNRQILSSWSAIIYSEGDPFKLDKCKYAAIQFISHVFPVALVMVVPRSGPVLQICGAIGGCIVDFSIPALLWLVGKRPSWKQWDLYACILLFLFGLVSCGISLYFGINDIIEEVKGTPKK
ncbi:Transmembrane amino acid transporter protein [Trichomonas vaginalis G3]|uniref:Transmembrane amino acid transporter protein n=1 Tax=Trichomonas vaginalis (strain ATCC PRA-98 / G3) TaxID=412133 RepID=A2DWG0_TRIV3|nr:amino acid transmembrane transporter protein [Trichomonas vaginalis G3]EAY15300.1 Transmembrane amino acid transporter protein [Trichomonas vaginalis G3]KAI5536598.1 amino acid transmembrane transporter protein [Trichomonas vaginalis G3]|eukprot:XP_001327523.1 Transmembrane amino acid transporter protein [Trichomonas vaginalis G3]